MKSNEYNENKEPFLNENGLCLPSFPVKVSMHNDTPFIYDEVRCKEVALTPEEWVRQHFLHWMMGDLGYPRIALSNEAILPGTKRRGRTDTIVFGTGGVVWMIIEFKAPDVSITEKVWNQLLSYNLRYKAPLLVASNGRSIIVAHVDYEVGKASFLKEMPHWHELKKLVSGGGISM